MELIIFSISIFALVIIMSVIFRGVRKSRFGKSQSDSGFTYFDSGSSSGDSSSNIGNDCIIDGTGDFGGDCGGGDGGGGGD